MLNSLQTDFCSTSTQIHDQSNVPMGFQTDASTGQNFNMNVFSTPQAN